MKAGFTAVMKRSGSWWIGWVAEVPGVNCQERTKEALLETLEVTLREALAWNRFLAAAGSCRTTGDATDVSARHDTYLADAFADE